MCRRRRLEPDAVAFYGAEIALALQCAHEHGVVYRDVKPENCFLDAAGHLKLGDFGLAKGGVRDPFRGAFSVCGTPEYMAPDVLAQHPAGYGTAVDFWGMGVCLYELLTGMPPWSLWPRGILPPMHRGGAAAATWIVRGDESAPRL